MKHYHCDGGCKTVKHSPGECAKKDCPKFGRDLCECFCLDGKHHHDLPQVKAIKKVKGKIHVTSLAVSLGVASGVYFIITAFVAYYLNHSTPMIRLLKYCGVDLTYPGCVMGFVVFVGMGLLMGIVIGISYNLYRHYKKFF